MFALLALPLVWVQRRPARVGNKPREEACRRKAQSLRDQVLVALSPSPTPLSKRLRNALERLQAHPDTYPVASLEIWNELVAANQVRHSRELVCFRTHPPGSRPSSSPFPKLRDDQIDYWVLVGPGSPLTEHLFVVERHPHTDGTRAVSSPTYTERLTRDLLTPLLADHGLRHP